MAGWKKILVSGLDLNSSTDISNNHIGVTDGSTTTDVTLGNNITFAAAGDLSVSESSGTITYSFTAGAVPNSFTTINAPNGTDPVASTATDTLNLTNGNGITITGNATTDTIDIKVADGGIDTAQLADDGVTYAKIQNVTTANRLLGSTTAGGAVTEVQVSGAMIAADAVNGSKIADDSINSEHIVNGSVDNIHLANSSVTFGSTEVSLGDSSTSIGGLTGLDFTAANASIAASIGANTLTLGGSSSTVVIAGDLTVSGETTTINTSELTVEDSLVRLANVGTPSADTANGAGIEVLTDEATYYPSIKWNKDGNGAGWELWQNGTSATDGAIAVMKTSVAVPSSVPSYGAGTFQLYTGGAEDVLYVYLG